MVILGPVRVCYQQISSSATHRNPLKNGDCALVRSRDQLQLADLAHPSRLEGHSHALDGEEPERAIRPGNGKSRRTWEK